jgi:hypothetical protein
MFYQESIGTGFFQSIGEDNEAVVVQMAAWQETVFVGGFG